METLFSSIPLSITKQPVQKLLPDDNDIQAQPRSHEASTGDFDLRGYEVARSQFFITARCISVTFSKRSVVFSLEAIKKLETDHIELLVNPKGEIESVSERRSYTALKEKYGKDIHRCAVEMIELYGIASATIHDYSKYASAIDKIRPRSSDLVFKIITGSVIISKKAVSMLSASRLLL